MPFNRRNEFRKLEQAYCDAMWTWGEIETLLYTIFSVAAGTRSKATKEAFFAVIGFRIRLDMIHSAARVTWKDSDYLRAWNFLYSECAKHAGKRGKIAHLSGVQLRPDKPHQKRIVMLAEHKIPGGAKTYGELKSSGYSIQDLKVFHKEWSILLNRLLQFCFWLLSDEVFRKHGEPINDPAHLLRRLTSPNFAARIQSHRSIRA